jgi:light-regulated signal transduction histidine kinase (bacteriophytochrome)
VVDLTDCDREPIHIPGAIQPYGVLLVLAEPALTVAQVSENVGDQFPLGVEDVLGQPLSKLIDRASADQVRDALREERWYETNPFHIEAHGKRFDGIVHRHRGAAILELEPDPSPSSATPMPHPFRRALIRIQRVSALAELAEVVVHQMQQVTGFERVMFYRFHEDGHGSVDAEAKEAALEPYLGLHYPASDIPAQARQLYLENWLRLIVDARATPARIVPDHRADTGGPLDLSFSVLRSVSPIHLEYMENMGVRASMSISLIVRNRLWGLISCLNHTSPRRISHEMRSACEFLGRLVSLEIDALEDRELLAVRASRRATEEALADAMRENVAEESALAVLLAHSKELMGLVSAGGAAWVGAGEPVTCGSTPPPPLIQEIAAWVEEREASRSFSTASLGALFPRALPASDVASGLLTFTLPGTPRRRLLWFRPEIIKTVNWGGDPTKPVAADSGERLRPRRSFALWREEVRFHSHPWTASDLEAADELRRRAIEVDLERRLLSERMAVRAREDLIAVVSHDLRNPLSSILIQAELMLKPASVGSEESLHRLRMGAERIVRSASHMKALIDDLLDLAKIETGRFTLHLQSIESRVLLDEALMVASALTEAKRITLAVDLIDLPRLEADPERIFRVLSNLLGNAVKFTPEGGTITVRAAQRGDELLIAVIDTGPGIAADHLPHVFERYWKGRPASAAGAGLGLYIAKGIVEAHGGRIWAESSAGGARLIFTLPLTRQAATDSSAASSGDTQAIQGRQTVPDRSMA